MLWQDLILLQLVFFVVGGPPCETWSAARFVALALEDAQHGPRPLRSQLHLWGLSALKRSESAQITVGNALLRAMITLFYTAATSTYTAVVMEHPAFPSWLPQAPSSWLLPHLKWIREHPNGDSLDIDQCMFRAASRKPTTLLAINCSALRDTVATFPNAGVCDGQHEHEKVLVGKAADGSFKTAPAKQYPPQLNLCLARTAAAVAQQRLGLAGNYDTHCMEDRAQSFFESEISAFFVPLDPFCAEQAEGHYGADFAGLVTNHHQLRARQGTVSDCPGLDYLDLARAQADRAWTALAASGQCASTCSAHNSSGATQLSLKRQVECAAPTTNAEEVKQP